MSVGSTGFSSAIHLCGPRVGAFTLIELLLVIGIIAVLMSLLMPAFRAARVSSQRIQCASNMRQVGRRLQSW
jgi:prepilin-type N-terminal cleavage/methylation domain-containing protein